MSSFEAPVPKKENLGGNIIRALPGDSFDVLMRRRVGVCSSSW